MNDGNIFVEKDDDSNNGFNRERKPLVRFKNGIQYQGEWLGNMRDGFGKQKWPDGALYEGEWINNKADGKGKFIHANGDYYEGEWKDDKANGYGIYVHNKTGAKY